MRNMYEDRWYGLLVIADKIDTHVTEYTQTYTSFIIEMCYWDLT